MLLKAILPQVNLNKVFQYLRSIHLIFEYEILLYFGKNELSFILYLINNIFIPYHSEFKYLQIFEKLFSHSSVILKLCFNWTYTFVFFFGLAAFMWWASFFTINYIIHMILLVLGRHTIIHNLKVNIMINAFWEKLLCTMRGFGFLGTFVN